MVSLMLKRVVFAVVVSSVFPTTLPAQAPAAGAAGLQPGDTVEIQVWQREELSGQFTVGPDGALLHPLYRQVRVTGLPVEQIESQVRSFLSRFESNPQLVVQPFYKVSISGPVMRPDIYDLPPGTTVAQAVIRAGGVTEGGKADDVRLVRAGSTTEVDLTEPTSAGAQQQVRSGDQILVETGGTGLGVVRSVILPLIQVASAVGSMIVLATN